MIKLEDAEIIDSVLKGNTRDFSLLIDRYKDKAFSLLVNMLKNSEDAEEVLQDSFLKAFNSLKNFKGESKFSTWFYRIVFNSGVTKLSAQKRKIEMQMNSFDETIQINNFDNEIYSTSENETEYLLKIIDKLPIKNSLVILLFYIDNLSIKEISEVMNISLSDVKVSLHRSRTMLRDLMIKHNYKKELK